MHAPPAMPPSLLVSRHPSRCSLTAVVLAMAMAIGGCVEEQPPPSGTGGVGGSRVGGAGGFGTGGVGWVRSLRWDRGHRRGRVRRRRIPRVPAPTARQLPGATSGLGAHCPARAERRHPAGARRRQDGVRRRSGLRSAVLRRPPSARSCWRPWRCQPATSPAGRWRTPTGAVHVVLRRGGAVVSLAPDRSRARSPRRSARRPARHRLRSAAIGAARRLRRRRAGDPARRGRRRHPAGPAGPRSARRRRRAASGCSSAASAAARSWWCPTASGEILERRRAARQRAARQLDHGARGREHRRPPRPVWPGGCGRCWTGARRCCTRRARTASWGLQPGGYGGGPCRSPIAAAVTRFGAARGAGPDRRRSWPARVLPIDFAESRDGKRRAIVLAGNSGTTARARHRCTCPGDQRCVRRRRRDRRCSRAGRPALLSPSPNRRPTPSRSSSASRWATPSRSTSTARDGWWCRRASRRGWRSSATGAAPSSWPTTRGSTAATPCSTWPRATVWPAPPATPRAATTAASGASPAIGPRRTQSLHGGIASTAPFHWDGDMRDLGHLMTEVFSSRMGGPQRGRRPREGAGRLAGSAARRRRLRPPATPRPSSAAGRCSTTRWSAAPPATAARASATTRRWPSAPASRSRCRRCWASVARAPYMHDGCAPTLKRPIQLGDDLQRRGHARQDQPPEGGAGGRPDRVSGEPLTCTGRSSGRGLRHIRRRHHSRTRRSNSYSSILSSLSRFLSSAQFVLNRLYMFWRARSWTRVLGHST